MLILRWNGIEGRRMIQTKDWTDEEIRYALGDASAAAYEAMKAAIERARMEKLLLENRCAGCGGHGFVGYGHCIDQKNCDVCRCHLCGGSGVRE